MEPSSSSEDEPLDCEDEISEADDESECLDIDDAGSVTPDNPYK
jgi:hypothetical protein